MTPHFCWLFFDFFLRFIPPQQSITMIYHQRHLLHHSISARKFLLHYYFTTIWAQMMAACNIIYSSSSFGSLGGGGGGGKSPASIKSNVPSFPNKITLSLVRICISSIPSLAPLSTANCFNTSNAFNKELSSNALGLTFTLTTVCWSSSCRSELPCVLVAPLPPMRRRGFLACCHAFWRLPLSCSKAGLLSDDDDLSDHDWWLLHSWLFGITKANDWESRSANERSDDKNRDIIFG